MSTPPPQPDPLSDSALRTTSRLRLRAAVVVHQRPLTAPLLIDPGQLRGFVAATRRSNLTTEERRVIGSTLFAQPLWGHQR